jgi:hypothetical protein
MRRSAIHFSAMLNACGSMRHVLTRPIFSVRMTPGGGIFVVRALTGSPGEHI